YSRGMTTSDISEQVKEIYGVDVSEGTISNVTNRIIEHVKEWQNRPLEKVYFTIWMDGIVLKVRQNGKYINKCIFIVIGLKNDGLKEVLGIWIAENESAAFWLTVPTDLKARSVISCIIQEFKSIIWLYSGSISGIVYQLHNSSESVLIRHPIFRTCQKPLLCDSISSNSFQQVINFMDQKEEPLLINITANTNNLFITFALN
ncbi:MAG TPA: hypothetical protein DIS74_00775, partial [Bacteroidales bacterium]|nr:hypothetical protein [Bacteroidales bacterium]